MNVKYINPFLTASLNLFKNYIGIDIKNEKPYINRTPHDLNEISAIIGLTGETIGSIVLSFTRDTAIKIVSQFVARPYTGLSKEVIDGVGELVNIIAGNARKDLKDFKLEISLPGVIIGKAYRIEWPKNVPIITIPFKSKEGQFEVHVSLKG